MEQLGDDIVRRFAEGDESAFRQIFDHFYPALYCFAKKLTQSHEDAKEIVLGVLQSLFVRCKMFETDANIKAFLYISVRNRGLNFLYAQKRQHQKQKEFAEKMRNDALLHYEFDIKDKLLDKINDAIEKLPEECRKIFKLLYLSEMEPAEIADMLHISVSTVYVQKSRAVKALRLMLADKPKLIGLAINTIVYLYRYF